MELTEATTSDHVPVLCVSGDVDLETADRLRGSLIDLIGGGSPLVVVDLSGVDFCDSSGLKVLDDIQRIARERGAAVALACPHERLLRLFTITGLTERFRIASTAEQAAAAATATHE